MKIGDIVKVKESHWHNPGMIGIIVDDLYHKGKAFKVLLSSGQIKPKIRSKLELIRSAKYNDRQYDRK